MQKPDPKSKKSKGVHRSQIRKLTLSIPLGLTENQVFLNLTNWLDWLVAAGSIIQGKQNVNSLVQMWHMHFQPSYWVRTLNQVSNRGMCRGMRLGVPEQLLFLPVKCHFCQQNIAQNSPVELHPIGQPVGAPAPRCVCACHQFNPMSDWDLGSLLSVYDSVLYVFGISTEASATVSL